MSDEEYRFAARSGRTTLYKFRPFQTDEHRERVRQIVKDHAVYFARASELNDPFDMTPRLEAITREGLLEGGNAYWSRHPDASPEERSRHLKYLAECDLATHAAEAEARVRERIERDYLVFSLAGNRDHPMLWSHYALGHTGLCIHFCAGEGAIFGASLGVTYVDARPLLPTVLRSIPDREIFQRVTLQKGKFWEYEEEFRFCCYPNTDYSDLPIKFDGQRAYFRPTELSGITVGARMRAIDIESVRELVREHDPPLPVWQAVETNTFAFNFKRVG